MPANFAPSGCRSRCGFFINLTECMPRFFQGGVAHRGPTFIFQTARGLSTKVTGSIATPDALTIVHRGDCSPVEDEPVGSRPGIRGRRRCAGLACSTGRAPAVPLLFDRGRCVARDRFFAVWALSASPKVSPTPPRGMLFVDRCWQLQTASCTPKRSAMGRCTCAWALSPDRSRDRRATANRDAQAVLQR